MSDEAPLVTGYGASFYPQRHGYTGHTPRPPAAAPRGPRRTGAQRQRATAEAAGTGAIPPDHAYTNRVKVGARAAGPPLWPAGGRGRPRGASPHSRVSRDETDVDVCNLQQHALVWPMVVRLRAEQPSRTPCRGPNSRAARPSRCSRASLASPEKSQPLPSVTPRPLERPLSSGVSRASPRPVGRVSPRSCARPRLRCSQRFCGSARAVT